MHCLCKASQTCSLHCFLQGLSLHLNYKDNQKKKDHYGLNQLLPLCFCASMTHLNSTQTLAEEKRLLQLYLKGHISYTYTLQPLVLKHLCFSSSNFTVTTALNIRRKSCSMIFCSFWSCVSDSWKRQITEAFFSNLSFQVIKVVK